MTAAEELPWDLHEEWISVADAATLAGVSEGTIRLWKHRGHLQATGMNEFGKPMFLGIDVLRAEAATRRRRRSA